MENGVLSWFKEICIKVSENIIQHVTNPSEFYLITYFEGYKGKYDGKKHAVSIEVIEKCEIEYSIDKINWTIEKPYFKNVCAEKCYVRVIRNKRIEEVELEIKISKREIVLSSESASKEYDGKNLSCNRVTISGDGLVDEDSITYSANGKRKLVGCSENIIEYSFDNEETKNNYDVVLKCGKINIKNRTQKYSIVLRGNSNCVKYDGHIHKIEGFENVDFVIGENKFYVNGIKTYAKSRDAGNITGEIIGKPIVLDKEGNDVTDQFDVQVIPAKLDIEKRNLELISDSKEKEYDGKKLLCGEYQLIGDGLVDNDNLIVKLRGERLLVGSTEISTEYKFKNVNAEKNYNIKLHNGSITIKPRTNKFLIKLLGKNQSIEYDGSVHKIEGFQKNEFEILDCKYFVSGLKASASAAVGEVSQNITGDVIIKDIFRNNVTDQFEIEVVPGILQITNSKVPYEIILKGKCEEKKYNGKQHILEEHLEQIVEIDSHKFRVYGVTLRAARTYVGSVETEVHGKPMVKDMLGNDVTEWFNIQIIPGKLEIKKRNLEITSGSIEREYNGKSLSCDKYKLEGDGLAENDNLIVKLHGERLLVGSTENNIEYQFENADIENNYNVILNNGLITIKPRKNKLFIKMLGKNRSIEYDGNIHKIDGFQSDEFEILDCKYIVSGLKAKASAAVGEILQDISGNATVRDIFGNDVTDQFNVISVPGILQILYSKNPYKIVVEGKCEEKKYDGTEHVLEENLDQIIEIDSHKFRVYGVILRAKKMHVGSVKTEVQGKPVVEDMFGNDVSEYVKVRVKAGKLIVLPRTVKITSASEKREYNGKNLENKNLEIEGDSFLPEDEPNILFDASQRDCGKYKNKFVLKMPDETRLEDYNIITEYGTLEIINRKEKYKITCCVESEKILYDGKTHCISRIYEEDVCICDVPFRVHIEYNSPIVKNAGSYSYQVKDVTVFDDEKNDVTKQFDVSVNFGPLEILKRTVCINSETAEKEYDGIPLIAERIIISGDGFVENEGAEFEFLSEQLLPGKNKNEFNYTLSNNTLKDNYNIICSYGELTVMDRKDPIAIELIGESKTYMYDGIEKNLPEFKSLIFEHNNKEYTIVGITNCISAIDAGIYVSTENKNYSIFDDKKNDITSQFDLSVAYGTLEILKRTVYIHSETAEKEYDGIPLIAERIIISGDGFVENEGAEFEFLSEQLLPGKNKNEFNYTLSNNTLKDNYNIICSYGELTVMDRKDPIAIELIGESKTYTYDGTEKNLPEFENLVFEYNSKKYVIEGISNCVSAIDVGDYKNNVLEKYSVWDENRYDVTNQFKVLAKVGTLYIEYDQKHDFEKSDIHFSRKELADMYVDEKNLLVGKEKNSLQYENLLKERIECDELDVLYNKIVKELRKVTLLSEIEISDDEFRILISYLRKKYINAVRNYRKEIFVDILFLIAMVQIGVRYYENSFWPHVCKQIGMDSISASNHVWMGGSVTETLLALGKPVYERNEYVTNIMMHCFITDSFASRFFDYLYQYYRLDLERDFSGFQEIDLEFLCTSIINPYAKRKQLLSDYAAMSIRADRQYCKEIIYKALTMIDCSFWDEEYNENILTGRLRKRFEEWKDKSSFYKSDRKKYREDFYNRNKIRKYRKPRIVFDAEKKSFKIFLPSQLVSSSLVESKAKIQWSIYSEVQRNLSCDLVEGFSTYRTKELEINIDANEIFNDYEFILWADNQKLRKFSWNERNAQFFSSEGNGISALHLEEGAVIAFANNNSKIESNAIKYEGYEMNLLYYELYINKGDFVHVKGEGSYYVGDIPKSGLSEKGKVMGVSVSEKKEKNIIPLYEKQPEIIIEVEQNQYMGTAVIVNGVVNKLSEIDYIKVQTGSTSINKYYFVSAEKLTGIQDGKNTIIIDYPKSAKVKYLEYYFLKDFEFQFIDAPYVFSDNGILKINRKVIDRKIYFEYEDCLYDIEFEMHDLKEGTLILEGNKEVDFEFEVPMLCLSWNKKEWFYHKPDDIWHKDLNRVIYLKYPDDMIGISVMDQEVNSTNLYRKRVDGIFECDLTKLLTYFSESKIVESLVLKTSTESKILLRILQKSVLLDATIESDYECNYIKAHLDILGKGSYYADLYCDGEIVIEKEIVSENLEVSFNTFIETADYTIEIFESDDEFGFDDDYTYVGEKEITLINPADLIGGCMKVKSVFNTRNQTYFEIDNNYRYYIYLEEQYEKIRYKAILVGIFHGDKNIMYASNALVTIKDLNNAEIIAIERLNEQNEMELFCYDCKKKSIVDMKKISDDRRLIWLTKEDTVLEIEYISSNLKRKDKAMKWVSNRKKLSEKQFSIWKE